MSMADTAAVLAPALDPGSASFDWGAIRGTFRGYPVLVEQRGSLEQGGKHLMCHVAGPGYGQKVDVAQAVALPEAAWKVTGNPAFDARFDVAGGSRALNVALFAHDPELQARLLAMPRPQLRLEGDEVCFGVILDATADELRAKLDAATLLFQRLPSAMERARALEAAGEPYVQLHPQTLAALGANEKKKPLIYGGLAVVIAAVVLLPILLVLVLGGIGAAVYFCSGPVTIVH